MPFFQHIQELRRRLLICVLTLAVTITFSFIVAERWLFPILKGPAPDSLRFLSTDSTGVIGPYMKVSFASGLILAMPMVVFQLVRFLAPGLKSTEKRYIYSLLPAALLAFAGGVTFGYFVMLPPALNFLFTFGSDIAEIRPNINSYVTMVTMLLFWIGVIFETPVVIYFLARIGIVNARMLSGFRRWAILGSFLLGAVITPTPDPINQTLVAVPIIVLYELSIWLAKIAGFQRRRSQRAAPRPQEELAH